MNKLIKEAENLYKQIDKAQVHLVNARLNNDEEGKKSAINEMETAMCNTMQLLKCFIDRKDNGAKWSINEFLKDLWHPVSEEPEENKKLLVQYTNYMVEDDYEIDMNSPHVPWGYIVTTYNFKKWCYIEDLLPKGGEK